MNLKLTRTSANSICTIGEMYIVNEMLMEEDFECFTLEDPIREVKLPGSTAIPSGEFEIVIDFSQRFQRKMPHLLNVPGFDGIRIHSGNTANDTSGCILVGDTKYKNRIGNSKAAYDRLFDKMMVAIEVGESISISIVDPI